MIFKILALISLFTTFSVTAGTSIETLNCRGIGASYDATAVIKIRKLFVGQIVRIELKNKLLPEGVNASFRTHLHEATGTIAGEGTLDNDSASISLEDQEDQVLASLHTPNRNIERGYGLHLICN